MKWILLFLPLFILGCSAEIEESFLSKRIIGQENSIDWNNCFEQKDSVVGIARQGIITKSYRLSDGCQNRWIPESNEIVVFRCQGDKPLASTLNCVTGCSKGECKPPSCKDDDGGKEYYLQGNTSGRDIDGNDGEFRDACINHEKLIEYYCDLNQLKATPHTCPKGCENGVCSELDKLQIKITRDLPKSKGPSFSESFNLEIIPEIAATNSIVRFVFSATGFNFTRPRIEVGEKGYKLYDDGFHGDSFANDGVFGVEVKNLPLGDYDATITYFQEGRKVNRIDKIKRGSVIKNAGAQCENVVQNRGKINLVLAGVGYGDSKPIIEKMISEIFNHEPFSSYGGEFNVWMATNGPSSYTNIKQGYKIVTACQLDNQFNLILNNGSLSYGSEFGHGAYRYGNAYHNPPFYDGTSVALHELMHVFGLVDEYSGEEIGISPSLSQCYFSSHVDCSNGCKETDFSYSDCIINAPWKEMIGNGCGESGAIDCTPDDDNYSIEVGCFLGCGSKNNLYRSTFDSGLRTITTPFKIGPVNEKIICERLTRLSGKKLGVCKKYE